LFEALHFIRRRRERLAEERAAERAHQLALLSQFTNMLENLTEAQQRSHSATAEALMEIAKASQAQAESFTGWLKSFQSPDPPTSTIVREEDELRDEVARTLAENGIDLANAELPPEFRLALSLRDDFVANVAGDAKP